MKKIQYGILLAILPLVLAFVYAQGPSKPLSMIKDISLSPLQVGISNISNTIVFKENFYFTNYFTETGEELWHVDAQGNISLVKESIVGPNNLTLKKMLTNGDRLYLFYGGGVGGDIVYHLQNPQEQLEGIETGLILNTESIKVKNGKLYAIGYDQIARKSEIIIIDGNTLEKVSDTDGSVTFTISAVEEFNNSTYFIAKQNGQDKLLKRGVNGDEVVYKEDGNHIVSLRATPTTLFFSVDRGFDLGTTLFAYDDSGLRELETFKYISHIQFVYGDYLALFAQRSGDSYPELWITSGEAVNATTNFQANNTGGIELFTVVKESAYYVQYDANGQSLFYLNQQTAQEVNIPITSYSNDVAQAFARFNNTLLVMGFAGTGPTSERGVWAVENGVPSSVFVKSGGLIPRTFTSESGVYLLETIDDVSPQVKKLYQYNPQSNTVELVVELDSSVNDVVGIFADKVFLASSNNTPYQALSKVENSVQMPLYATGVTGSSNPKDFVPINDKTYFIAKHDEFGDSVWQSDGLDVVVLGDTSDGNQNTQIEQLFNINGKLIFAVNNNGLLKFWKSDGEALQKLSDKSFGLYQDDLVFTGNSVYFSGTDGVPGTSTIWMVDESGVNGVVNNGSNLTLTPFDMTHTAIGTFFRTGTEENSKLWSISGDTANEVQWNGLKPYGNSYSEFLSDGSNLYYKSCKVDSGLVIYSYNNSQGLRSVEGANLNDVDCSQVKSLVLEDEVVLFVKRATEFQLWMLKDKEFTVNPAVFYQVGSGYEVVEKDALYFIARESGSSAATVYIYRNGEVVNTSIEAEKMWVTQTNTKQPASWLITVNSYSGSEAHDIHSINGFTTEFVTQISADKGDVLSVTEVDGRSIIQTANSRSEVDLIELDSQGQIASLVHDGGFSYGGFNDSRQQYPIAAGHGKWLFLKVCDYLKGCEPYSLDYNLSPTAKAASAKTSYYGGTEVTLSGQGSSDPDNDSLTYKWEQVSGKPARFESVKGPVVTLEAPEVSQEQTLSIALEVTDEGYAKATDIIDVTIIPNAKPIVKIKAPSSASEGDTVQLDGTESVDEDGDSLSYSWSVVSGTNVSLNNVGAANASFSVPTLSKDSSVTIKLTVIDEVGAEGHETVTINLKKTSSGESGSGGGSANWLLLFMLVSFVLLRFGYYRL